MSLVLVTPPVIEPLTLSEVRAHLRVDETNVEPAPSVAPLAALASQAGNVDVGTHRYRVTFVTADGETQGGDESNAVAVTVSSNAQVNVSEIPVGGASVTARRVYRTKAGLNVFYLLATIGNNSATSYIDNVPDSALGAEVPSQNTTGDSELWALITTAREHVENDIRRKLITQQWRWRTDEFPSCGRLRLPLQPIISVDAVTYIDTAGDTQTLANDQYDEDLTALPPVLHRAYQGNWPSVRNSRLPVSVLLTVGYGPIASSVPKPIRQAMLLLIGELYENRESINIGNIVNALPAYDRLLDPYRVRWFV